MSKPPISESEAVRREREAFVRGAEYEWTTLAGGDGGSVARTEFRQREAAYRFALPMVERLRIVPDPHTIAAWRINRRSVALCAFEVRTADGWSQDTSTFFVTAERVAMWADLLANPVETVPSDE